MSKLPLYKKVAIEKLRPFSRNSRTHSDEQIDQVVKSITEFGFTNPLLIDENCVLVAGHCRLLAAKKLGMSELPCIELAGLTDAQKRALVIADNKLSLNAGWDNDILLSEIQALKDLNFDIELTGFSLDEIDDLIPELVNEGLIDEDTVPDIQVDATTKLGDIWILGNHRLMCGDSTNSQNVDTLTEDRKPNLMVTDPPYGVNYDPSWREGADLGIGKRSKGKVKNDDLVNWTSTYSLFTGNIAYVWHAGKYTHIVAKNLEDCEFDIISQIIWSKQHFVLSRGDYHWQHEPCWYVVKKGQNHNWQGARDQATIWNIKNNNSFGNPEKEETWGHGTQKPLECMARPILNNSEEKEYVYDPFGGSGTTLIACEKHNRKCLMMELDPRYCDVIIKRWQQFTGKDAILESNNKTFTELSHDKTA